MAIGRLFPPPQDCTALRPMLPRVVLTVLFGWVALKVGFGYIHLCEAGSRVVEGSAAFGAPLAVCALVLFVRRPWVAILSAALVTLGVYALCRPYLDWIHHN
jgi:hypothetical protein